MFESQSSFPSYVILIVERSEVFGAPPNGHQTVGAIYSVDEDLSTLVAFSDDIAGLGKF